jgi:hypothetical protein
MANVLEDKDAIRELIAEYCFLIDGAEYPAWVELFTMEGVFEVVGMFSFQGREKLLQFARTIPLNDEGRPGFKHCTLNSIVRVSGERATARCYFLLVHEGRPLRVDVAGRYEDTLVKQDGRWLFERRTVTFDYHSLPER